ncbi:MAG: DUF3343 domain-containing protein, partial [Dethiobacteria bacterium]
AVVMAASCYITFSTPYFALRAEDLLRQTEYAFKMVPVPRSISSSCGTALLCRCEEAEAICRFLAEKEVEWAELHRLEEEEGASFLSFFRKGGR